MEKEKLINVFKEALDYWMKNKLYERVEPYYNEEEGEWIEIKIDGKDILKEFIKKEFNLSDRDKSKIDEYFHKIMKIIRDDIKDDIVDYIYEDRLMYVINKAKEGEDISILDLLTGENVEYLELAISNLIGEKWNIEYEYEWIHDFIFYLDALVFSDEDEKDVAEKILSKVENIVEPKIGFLIEGKTIYPQNKNFYIRDLDELNPRDAKIIIGSILLEVEARGYNKEISEISDILNNELSFYFKEPDKAKLKIMGYISKDKNEFWYISDLEKILSAFKYHKNEFGSRLKR